LKSRELVRRPASTRITLRPAALSISALTPPPAPVPMITTSASRVRSSLTVAPSIRFHFSLALSQGSAMF